MTIHTKLEKSHAVQVVEADIFDRMNETTALIAQRAYEIYKVRGGAHGSDRDDWFSAEQRVLQALVVERRETENTLRLTAQLPGFDAKDLEVAIGHRRAVICGVHATSNQSADADHNDKKVMRIVELPFDVDPVLASATLDKGTLEIVFPRSH